MKSKIAKSLLSEYLMDNYPQISEPERFSAKLDLYSADEIAEFILSAVGTEKKVVNEATVLSRVAFGTKYEHGEKALNHFKDFVDKVIMDYPLRPTIYHSLHFSFVQSSCTGKSRLVLESGRSKMHVLYCCLRDRLSSGYPLGNQKVLGFFDYNNDERSMKDFLIHVYLYFCKLQANSDETFPLASREGGDVKFAAVWDDILREYDIMSRKAKDDLENAFKSLQNNKDAPVLLLAIDEASALFRPSSTEDKSVLMVMRSALRKLQSTKLLLVFIDTLSTIVHLQPSICIDPSERPDLPFDIVPPFYEMLTFNCNPANFHHKMGREAEIVAAFSYGRPVWHAYFFQNIKNRVFSATLGWALDFAKLKLSFSNRPERSLYSEAAFAVAAVRFGIYGVTNPALATLLMYRYMGVGMYFGEDRMKMQVEYIPEPIIAEAACQLLHGVHDERGKGQFEFSNDRICSVLKIFTAKCVSGLVDAGLMGEITARVMLSLAYDYVHLEKAEKNQKMPTINYDHLFSDPITVKEFLDALFSDEYCSKYKEYFGCQPINLGPTATLEGEVCFTSWIQLSSLTEKCLPEDLLKECFYLRCAIILPMNHGGYDLVIPVRLRSGRFTMIAKQVKNTENTFAKFFECTEHQKNDDRNFISDPSVLANAISIYIDVSTKTIDDSFYGPTMISDLFASPIAQVEEAQSNEAIVASISEKRTSSSERSTKIEGADHTGEDEDSIYSEFPDLTKRNVLNFHNSNLNHCVLLGLETAFIKECLLEMLSDFQREKIDRIEEKSRSEVLKLMNHLKFR